MVNGSGYCFPLSISLFLCCCYHKRVQHRTDTVINLNWNGNLHSGYVHETSSIIMWHYHWYSEKVGGWFSSIVINNLVRKTSKVAYSLTKDFNYRVRHHLFYFDRESAILSTSPRGMCLVLNFDYSLALFMWVDATLLSFFLGFSLLIRTFSLAFSLSLHQLIATSASLQFTCALRRVWSFKRVLGGITNTYILWFTKLNVFLRLPQ